MVRSAGRPLGPGGERKGAGWSSPSAHTHRGRTTHSGQSILPFFCPGGQPGSARFRRICAGLTGRGSRHRSRPEASGPPAGKPAFGFEANGALTASRTRPRQPHRPSDGSRCALRTPRPTPPRFDTCGSVDYRFSADPSGSMTIRSVSLTRQKEQFVSMTRHKFRHGRKRPQALMVEPRPILDPAALAASIRELAYEARRVLNDPARRPFELRSLSRRIGVVRQQTIDQPGSELARWLESLACKVEPEMPIELRGIPYRSRSTSLRVG